MTTRNDIGTNFIKQQKKALSGKALKNGGWN